MSEPALQAAEPDVAPPQPPAAEGATLDEVLPDMDDDVEAAKKVLYEVVEDGVDDEGEPAEKPAEPEEPEALDNVGQMRKLLANLSEQERVELLGTSDDAFAALQSKKKRAEKAYAKVQTERQYIETVKSQLDALVDKAQSDPISALELLGWTPEQLVAFTENGEVPAERWQKSFEAGMEKKLAEHKEELASIKHETNVQRWHGSVEQAVTAVVNHEDKFPLLVQKMGQGKIDPQALKKRIIAGQSEYFKQHGKPLALGEAFGYLERELREARQLWLDEIPDPAQAGSVKSVKSPEAPEPLLSNRLASQRRTPQAVAVALEELDDDELMKRAKARLYEE